MYKIFPSAGRESERRPRAAAIDRQRYREFWALRGIDFELAARSRLGIIGRNGAGKSTLLKLITQNIVPTEGPVEVQGEVQALIEAGGGFHPEFTGEENIRAALTLQGVPARTMPGCVEEIAEFTELGEFLGQPFRTYSAGMQARLAFATATAVEPDILIVDEMLERRRRLLLEQGGRADARARRERRDPAARVAFARPRDDVLRRGDLDRPRADRQDAAAAWR